LIGEKKGGYTKQSLGKKSVCVGSNKGGYCQTEEET